MAGLTDRQRQVLRAREMTEEDFAEVVRDCETILEAQQRTRIGRRQVSSMISKLGLKTEVKTGGSLLEDAGVVHGNAKRTKERSD